MHDLGTPSSSIIFRGVKQRLTQSNASAVGMRDQHTELSERGGEALHAHTTNDAIGALRDENSVCSQERMNLFLTGTGCWTAIDLFPHAFFSDCVNEVDKLGQL